MLLLEQGVELITIAQMLGHARITITAEVYAKARELHQAGVNLLAA